MIAKLEKVNQEGNYQNEFDFATIESITCRNSWEI